MKIVEIIPTFYPVGGAEKITCDLCLSFLNKEEVDDIFVVCLYSNNKDNYLIGKLKAKGIKVFFLDKTKGVDFKCAKKLRKIILDIKPDVIHCHLNTILTIFLSRLCGKYPIFYTFHTLISEKTYGNKNKPINLLNKYLMKTGKLIPISISNNISVSISQYYKIPLSKIFCIPNGVTLESFPYLTKLKERGGDFIYIGRFINIKRPKLIIEAFEHLLESRKDCRLLMLGDGPCLEDCKKYVLEHKLDTNICLKGFVNEPVKYLQQSKVLVLASEYEGNPIVCNEAIASGVFVLSTEVGGVPDIISADTGVLVKPNIDSLKLGDAMFQIINNINNVSSVVDQNIAYNRKRVSIENTVDKYIQCFKTKERI